MNFFKSTFSQVQGRLALKAAMYIAKVKRAQFFSLRIMDVVCTVCWLEGWSCPLQYSRYLDAAQHNQTQIILIMSISSAHSYGWFYLCVFGTLRISVLTACVDLKVVCTFKMLSYLSVWLCWRFWPHVNITVQL